MGDHGVVTEVECLQSKANVELELKTMRMKYDQEVLAHKETVARFNADKKNILHSTEEANMEALKGLCGHPSCFSYWRVTCLCPRCC